MSQPKIAQTIIAPIDLQSLEPAVSSSFTLFHDHIHFSQTMEDMKAHIFDPQIGIHFLEYLTYFRDNSEKYKKVKNIHFIQYIDGKPHYHLRTTNKDIEEESDIFINYDPSVFKPEPIKEEISEVSLIPPKIKMGKININFKLFDLKNKLSSKWHIFSGFITTINCFAYIVLNYWPNSDLANHPFLGSWSIINSCVWYSLVGNWISNIKPPFSSVIINLALGIINYGQIKKYIN